MNLAAFSEYWRTTHAEAVKRVPKIRRYVQSPTIASGYRTRERVYDGIAEIWYEDIAAMRRAAATPEAAAALEDDDNFIDMKSFASIITDEVVQRDAETDPSMVKLNEFVIRKPDSDPAAFHKYWSEVHGPLGATIKPAAIRAEPCAAFRVSRRTQPIYRRGGAGLVRRHQRDARVGENDGIRNRARRRAKLHRRVAAVVHHYAGTNHHRLNR
jgi:uncharacterized protein (TIGR02118 family)